MMMMFAPTSLVRQKEGVQEEEEAREVEEWLARQKLRLQARMLP